MRQNSCDEPYDYDIEDRSVFMIWALGDAHDFSFHGGRRGQVFIKKSFGRHIWSHSQPCTTQFTANLLAPPAKHTDLSQYNHVDFLMPNVEGRVRLPVLNYLLELPHFCFKSPEERRKSLEAKMIPTRESNIRRSSKLLLSTHSYFVHPCSFICTYFDLDVMAMDMNVTHKDKIHVVGYEPKIEEGNEKYFHHMILSSCGGTGFGTANGQGTFEKSEIYHKKAVPNCQTLPRGCQNLWAAHAVGADSEGLPPNVGLPVGEGERWVVMQMHYYNPRKDEGVYDNSGMRVFMTSEPRPIDAGRMGFAVGVSEGQHPPIPGGQKEVPMKTLFVEPECSEQWTEPLNIISVGHHSHFHGLHQDLTVERDGVNLGPIRKVSK